MQLLTFIGVILIVYVVSFKEEFTSEHIQRVMPFLVLVIVGITILGILFSTPINLKG